MLATELHGHLDDLSASLTQMIEAVNELSNSSDNASSTSASSDDPMAQIAQVLSNHLESLQWIDGAVREVESKVGEVERRVKSAAGDESSGSLGSGGLASMLGRTQGRTGYPTGR